ncbi:MAG: hypothetical protein AAF206_26050, partial [Bacteroidota bacterium]
MKRLKALFFLCFALLIAPHVRGQVDFFSTQPEIFIDEFTNVLNEAKGGKAQLAANAIRAVWTDSLADAASQEPFMRLANIMVSQRHKSEGGLTFLALAYSQILKGDTYASINMEEFLAVTLQAVTSLEPKRSSKYLRVLSDYLAQGYLMKREKFSWQANAQNPSLTMLELTDQEGKNYSAPVLRFPETDLYYRSSRDSTMIYQTQGDFNLVALSFIG